MTKAIAKIIEAVAAEVGKLTEEQERQVRACIKEGMTDALEIAETIDLDDEQDDRPNSVVKAAYKAKYRERAASMKAPKGVSTKAMKRSTCDWLALELMKRTLTEGKKPQLIVAAFEGILDANGVKHSHWNRTTPGWQGRLRMTGRLALQRVVAEAGELAVPGEEAVKAPKAWVAKHSN